MIRPFISVITLFITGFGAHFLVLFSFSWFFKFKPKFFRWFLWARLDLWRVTKLANEELRRPRRMDVLSWEPRAVEGKKREFCERHAPEMNGWNLKMHGQRNKAPIFGFHVNFRGCVRPIGGGRFFLHIFFLKDVFRVEGSLPSKNEGIGRWI